MRTLRIWLLILAAVAQAASLAGQDVDAPKPVRAQITGTIIDVNRDAVPAATVVLAGAGLKDPRTAVSTDNGFFAFGDLDAGTYNITIRAEGFAVWTSPAIDVAPGQYVILPSSELTIAEALTTVSVAYSPIEVATEEVRIEEQQRVFGIIPNFYVVYDHEATPLTTKLKYRLALRTSFDPATIVGAGALAAMNQAGNTPNYRQGWVGYAERYGAAAGDGLSDIMIGGAILPSLLHQDPRYFYQGAGSDKSRALHALSAPFVCRGDNGKREPNYSSLGGDLASASLSNAYYPPSNRGAGLVFENVALTTGERMVSALVQEFVLGKFTVKAKNRR